MKLISAYFSFVELGRIQSAETWNIEKNWSNLISKEFKIWAGDILSAPMCATLTGTSR